MDIRKLQRAIVDGLEDVKAHDIRVYNTTHLTALFDRVVVAGGTSNRQTRALASSVRDKVKAAGGDVISIEGEESGEWVLVDCQDAIVHIMQPALRQYYNIEELWGEKPVRVKLSSGSGRFPGGGPLQPLDDAFPDDEDEGAGTGRNADVDTPSERTTSTPARRHLARTGPDRGTK